MEPGEPVSICRSNKQAMMMAGTCWSRFYMSSFTICFTICFTVFPGTLKFTRLRRYRRKHAFCVRRSGLANTVKWIRNPCMGEGPSPISSPKYLLQLDVHPPINQCSQRYSPIICAKILLEKVTVTLLTSRDFDFRYSLQLKRIKKA